MIEISMVARDLVGALKSLGRKKKPVAVDMWFDADQGLLVVEEALHGLFASEAPASGSKSTNAQVDGRLLHAIATRHPAGSMLGLAFGDTDLTVKCGGSTARLPAMRVQRKPLPRNPKHKGPVAVVPEGRLRTPKGDTWVFSAQVPFKPDKVEN